MSDKNDYFPTRIEQIGFVVIDGVEYVKRSDAADLQINLERFEANALMECNRYKAALAGIPNPEAVRELVEAARAWAMFQAAPTTAARLRETDERLMAAVLATCKALSAPSTGAQQKGE